MIPPRVVLVAVDFSDPSRTALLFARRLAGHTGASLHVLHAQEPLLAEGARQAGFDLARDTEAELERFAAEPPRAGAERPPHLQVATGPAVDVVVQTAHGVGADVVVVGSHGMSGAERIVFGSTTEGVLRRAPCSVLVTPADWRQPQPWIPDLSDTGPIIAAVDFTPAATEAAKAACRLATALSTAVEMIHVVPEPPVLVRWRSHAAAAIGNRVEAAREQLAGLAKSMACEVAVQVRVDQGAVAPQLAERTASSDSRWPILVLGQRSPGEKGGRPGVTAYRVLMLSKVPVLMYVAG